MSNPEGWADDEDDPEAEEDEDDCANADIWKTRTEDLE